VERNPDERPLRILVVDDCEDTTASLAWLLRAWGFVAEEANSGRGALMAASASSPDVVLLDLMMPGMDGWAIARELRKLPGLEGLVLVILSGCNGVDAVSSIPKVEYDLQMRKPLDLESLRHFLTHCEKEICCHVSETTGPHADESRDGRRCGGCHR